MLCRSISTPWCTFSAQFVIDNGTFSTDIGGAQPLVARARAPVCSSLATPLPSLADELPVHRDDP